MDEVIWEPLFWLLVWLWFHGVDSFKRGRNLFFEKKVVCYSGREIMLSGLWLMLLSVVFFWLYWYSGFGFKSLLKT